MFLLLTNNVTNARLGVVRILQYSYIRSIVIGLAVSRFRIIEMSIERAENLALHVEVD